jgi:hypothetical protein
MKNYLRPIVPSRPPAKREALFFFSLVLISVVPAWTVTYFPSQDGPIHLWILHIISSYSAPDAQVLRQFFEPNRFVEPNLGFYVIAYPLSLLFGIAVAEKIYLSLLTLILCYGVRYAIAAINPHGMALSYLAVPIAFGFFTHMGFYNFVLGVALFLPVLAFCIVQYHKEGIRGYLKIGVAGLLLVLAHLVPFAAFLFTFALYILAHRIILAVNTGEYRIFMRRLASETAALTAVFSPAVLIAASFTMRHGITENPAAPWLPLKYYFELFLMFFLQSFDGIELVLIAGPYLAVLLLAFILIAWHIFRHGHISTQTFALAIALLGLTLLCLHAPISSKDIPLSPRLAPLVVLTGIIALAAGSGRAKLSLIVVLSAGVILVGSGYRYTKYGKFQQEVAEVLSLAEHISTDATFLPIRLEQEEIHSIWKSKRAPANPMLQVGAYIAIERKAVYFRSPLMSPSRFAYFPYAYRKEADPFVLLGSGIERVNPEVDFEQFRLTTGRSIDFIIIGGSLHELAGDPVDAVEQIRKELNLNYRFLLSSARDRYQLYESIERDQGQGAGLSELLAPL